MKLIGILFALLFSATAALAQGCGNANPNCIVPTAPVGTNTNQAASTAFVQQNVLRSYIAGLTLSNDGTSPNTVLDVSAGQATDSANVVSIKLAAFTKATAGAWTSGTGNNGMGQGLTIANTTWYHVFAIINTGAADVYFDTSVSAANAPSGTTANRRIGSFLTDGSAHIITFSQNGEEFIWSTTVVDYNAGQPGNGPRSLVTLTVPTGVKVNALFRASTSNSSDSILFTAPDESDQASSASAADLTTPGNTVLANGRYNVRTNTSSQIGVRQTGSNSPTTINTFGWIDTRGRFN